MQPTLIAISRVSLILSETLYGLLGRCEVRVNFRCRVKVGESIFALTQTFVDLPPLD